MSAIPILDDVFSDKVQLWHEVHYPQAESLIRTEWSLKTATHSPVWKVQDGGFKVTGNIHVCANDGFSSLSVPPTKAKIPSSEATDAFNDH